MKKIILKLKAEDILNILNLVVFVLCLLFEKRLLVASFLLFLMGCIIAAVRKIKKQKISFFRYMWSFVCTSLGYASGINVLSDIKKLLILYIIVSMAFVYLITRNDSKNLPVKLLYVLCLTAILHGTVIGINCNFCKDEEINISAEVVHKQKNGDWFDTDTFSQIEVYSSATVYNESFGYRTIDAVGALYDFYEIDDDITVYVNRGIFNITYYYLKDG